MKRITRQLFRLKDLNLILSESHDPLRKLKKVLGPLELILFGIGVIIGAGIFATVGTAAAGDNLRPGAGPALILSFAITAVACGFAALCYAEFASLVPISGSAYTYSYATFGELVAWIIGWDLMLEYSVGSIAVSLSWSGYFTSLLSGIGIHLPPWLTIDLRSALQGYDKAAALLSGGAALGDLTPALQKAWNAIHGAPRIFGTPVTFNFPASAIVLILTAILVRGIKESSRFNVAIVIIKLLVLGFFISLGAFFIKPENWVPFAPNGFAGIKAGAAIAFFAYIGFDCVSTVAEETRDPKRDMPIGIIGSLIVCTVIYMLVAAVFTGIIPVGLLKTSLAHGKAEPLALAMQHIGLGWAAVVIAFGSIVAQIAVLLVLQMGQSRIFFSMARDGLLPKVFSSVHKTFRTPHVTTIVTGLIIAAVAGSTNIDEMVDLTNIGTLFAFVLVCFGIVILRVKEPNRPRGFTVPWNPVIPLLGVASCIFLMTGLPGITWIRFILWLVAGLIVYFSYGIRHSRIRAMK
ncbi:MAG: amino acid permease [Candidatus Omnitrophica bacterium]|nr:amino acid permease [Candidatus Omnitrophota bacterium]